MARVFIPTTSGKNAKVAMEQSRLFGEPVGILHRDAFPDDHALRISKMRWIIEGVLGHKDTGFDPAADFIMFFGDPIAQTLIASWLQFQYDCGTAATAHKFRGFNGDSVRFLKWDRSEQCYYQVVVPFTRGDGIEQDSRKAGAPRA